MINPVELIKKLPMNLSLHIHSFLVDERGVYTDLIPTHHNFIYDEKTIKRFNKQYIETEKATANEFDLLLLDIKCKINHIYLNDFKRCLFITSINFIDCPIDDGAILLDHTFRFEILGDAYTHYFKMVNEEILYEWYSQEDPLYRTLELCFYDGLKKPTLQKFLKQHAKKGFKRVVPSINQLKMLTENYIQGKDVIQAYINMVSNEYHFYEWFVNSHYTEALCYYLSVMSERTEEEYQAFNFVEDRENLSFIFTNA